MNQITEKHVEVASRLYQMRKSARLLGRTHYEKTIKESMEQVRKAAVLWGLSHMKAGFKLAKLAADDRDVGDVAVMWVLAATVELIEPDDQTPEETK